MSGKNVLIMESMKTADIQRFLGSSFIVLGSKGHILELDPTGMNVDFDNNFHPTYREKVKSESIIRNIKKACKNADMVYIGTDGDREGEFIGESIIRVAKLPKTKYKRIVFYDKTKKAIKHAIDNPTTLDTNKVKSQQTRQILDRIIGYLLSPQLSQLPDIETVCEDPRKLGTGRVQCVVTNLIVEKERQIEEFMNGDNGIFYEGKGDFTLSIDGTVFQLATDLYVTEPKIKIWKLPKDDDDVYDKVIKIINKLRKCQWELVQVKKRTIKRNPPPPYITSTLQRDASTKLSGWNIERIMNVAQRLYEGGHITYMRTDSTVLCNEAHEKIKSAVDDVYGEEYYTQRLNTNNSTSAQEAHEAIRPTVFTTMELEDSEQNELYKLIWKRAVSSQMATAVIESTQLFLSPYTRKGSLDYLMVGSVSRIKFDGYMILMDKEKDVVKFKVPNALEDVIVQRNSLKMKESMKMPPPRYNEASLVETMEKLGIGRPSTYVNSIKRILEKGYVVTGNVSGKKKMLKTLMCDDDGISVEENKLELGKENKRLIPTELGEIVTEFLVDKFPQIVNVDFTAKMELDLDEIGKGNKVWCDVLHKFYDGFLPLLDAINAERPPRTKTISLNKSNDIIGKFSNDDYEKFYGQDIEFLKIKKDYVIKIFDLEAKKDVWVNVKIRPTLDEAMNFIINKPVPAKVLKVLGKYTIKQNEGKQPFIQSGSGKSIKFCSCGGMDPQEMTVADCKKLSTVKRGPAKGNGSKKKVGKKE
jgi:DNA topoisomerase I